MIGRIIDDYLAGVENGRVVVPGWGAYIKRGGGETIFVDLLRTDDTVLTELIIRRLHCTNEQAQALIADYIAEQRGEKKVPEQMKAVNPKPVAQPTVPPQQITAYPPKTIYPMPIQSAKRRKKVDPVIVIAIIAVICVIGLIVVAYVKNGGESLGL